MMISRRYPIAAPEMDMLKKLAAMGAGDAPEADLDALMVLGAHALITLDCKAHPSITEKGRRFLRQPPGRTLN